MSDRMIDYHVSNMADHTYNLHLQVHGDNTATKDVGEPLRLETRHAIEKAVMHLQGVLDTDMKRRKEKLGAMA